MRKGGGIGLVLLVVVLAVVLLLVARSWRTVAPTAIQVSDGPGADVVVPDHGETAAGAAVSSGDLPDLDQLQQQTDAHAQQVQEALAAPD